MISPFAILTLLILLALSGFFSGAEVALLTTHRIRVDRFVQEGRKGAKALQRLAMHPKRMIITILIGNNVVNVAASALTTVIAQNAFGSSAIGYAAGILTLFLLIFGEISPKTLAQAGAGRIALAIARPIEILGIILFPIVWTLEHISTFLQRAVGNEAAESLNELEIMNMVRFGVAAEVIEPEEQYIINRAMRFSDTTVDEVMTIASRIFALEAHLPATSVIDAILNSGFSRIPIYRGSLQNIIGIVLLKEVMQARVDSDSAMLEELAHEPIFIAAGTPIDDVFKIFQKKRTHMGIVRDASDGILGLVTLEDLLEELVGEIDDETDRELNPHEGLVETDQTQITALR